MRILYLGRDYNNTFAASWYYLMKYLCKENEVIRHGPSRQYRHPFLPQVDLKFLGPIGNGFQLFYSKLRGLRESSIVTDVEEVVNHITPDVILMDSFFPPSPGWKNLDKVDIPKAMVISDPHFRIIEKLEYASRYKFNLLLFDCEFVIKSRGFKKWSEFNQDIRYEWLPHSVNAEVFKDYGYEREFDVVSSGSMAPSVYPLRQVFFEKLRKNTSLNFRMPRHARHEIIRGVPIERTLVREPYARFIARSKILLFDSSIYNYPLMKYFEGMACQTLVIAPKPKDSVSLHFVPDYNFVEVDIDNFEDQLMYYLQNDDERMRISLNGRSTIEKYHSTSTRANQLTCMLREISR